MFRRAFRTSPSHDRRRPKRPMQHQMALGARSRTVAGALTCSLALILATLAMFASPAAGHQPADSVNVTNVVTTVPADATVYRVDNISMSNSDSPCKSGFSFKTPGGDPRGVHVVAPGVTVSVTGDKTTGYTVATTRSTAKRASSTCTSRVRWMTTAGTASILPSSPPLRCSHRTGRGRSGRTPATCGSASTSPAA